MDAAVMRFVGVRRRTIFWALVLEAALVSVLGSVLGAGLAWLAGAATNAYYRRYFDTELIFALITPRIVLFSVCSPCCSAWRPAPWRPGDWCAPARWCSGVGHDGARLGPAQPRSPPAPHRALARRYRGSRCHAARHGDAERRHREVVQRAAPRARLSDSHHPEGHVPVRHRSHHPRCDPPGARPPRRARGAGRRRGARHLGVRPHGRFTRDPGRLRRAT